MGTHMSAGDALHHLTVSRAADLIGAGSLSPVALVEAVLARAVDVQPIIHAYVALQVETALAEAHAAAAEIAAGRRRGPLHGIPFAVKDTIDTQGLPAAAGSRLRLDHVPAGDATAVHRLRQAGAILIGKLATYEFGTGTGNDLAELPFEPARNPWDPARLAAGSSTGAGAAVACGAAVFALGSDTGGSVRLPAASCGTIGLKPTYGLVSRAGMLPNCWSLDAAGPITWSAADAGLVLDAIAGHDPQDPTSVAWPSNRAAARPVRGLRIGVLRRFHERDIASDPAIATGFDAVVAALGRLGATLVEVDLPASLQDFRACNRIINISECLAAHAEDYRTRRTLMGTALREKFAAGLGVSALDYLDAQRWRRVLADAVRGLFDTCDIVLCAGTTRPPPLFADRAAVAAFTAESAMAVFNISGLPAISVRAGFCPDGMPVGVQLAAPAFGEALLVGVAQALEEATPWAALRPRPETMADRQAVFPPAITTQPDAPAAARAAGIAIANGLDPDATDIAQIAAQAASTAAAVGRIPRPLPRTLEPLPRLIIPEPS